MENASKALIIAAAILLSILIIALGMRVFNSARSATGSVDLSPQEISSHNSRFEAYVGRQRGDSCIELCNMIAKNNDEYEDRKIRIWASNKVIPLVENGNRSFPDDGTSIMRGDTVPAKIRSKMTNIKRTATYLVRFVYEGNDGLIDKVEISYYE